MKKYSADEVLSVYNVSQEDMYGAAEALGMSASTAYGIWNGTLYQDITKHGDPEGLYTPESRLAEPKQGCSVTYQTLRSPISTSELGEGFNG